MGWASRRRSARAVEVEADRGLKQGRARSEPEGGGDRCGLCGKRRGPTRTECCDRPICDDEGEYVLFSYARNSCSRNHRRFTLCGLHHTEGHAGAWKSCVACREYFAELEMYVYYGTNGYNFEKLENPPAYEPTRCGRCRRVIVLGEEGFSVGPNGYRCEDCYEA